VAESCPVIFTPLHRGHDPRDHPDTPARGDLLLRAALEFGLSARSPDDAGLLPIEAVHAPGLLALLQTAYQRFAQLREGPRPAVPDTFAVREFGARALSDSIPRSIWGQLGHYCTDNLTPILPRTWEAAYWSAQIAVSAADALNAGAPLVYALCRPPGHHAFRDLYGGFCYLNNVAIAADLLTKHGRRPAIIDIDYHHGNGTQAIFYERADVFFCSIHADPDVEYPYYCGFAHETGRGAGQGYTLNLPLPLETEETDYLRALDTALTATEDFAPDVVLVSLGFDTLAGDPQGGMQLEVSTFAHIGRELAGLRRPLLVIQEGGYLLPALGPALSAFLEGVTNN
jgi:acetoin utilization deacetylase AcuC-like enzyme